MGRNAGWVTAASALAARVTNCEVLTYLPEKLVDMDVMLKDIEKAYAKGHGCLVTVSEGLCGPDGNPLADSGIVDGFGHKVPGGVGEYISRQIMQKIGLKSRAEKPGLLGRTSIAYQSEVDRLEAYAVGKKAVEAAAEGKTGFMVAINADRSKGFSFTLDLVPLADVANVEKKFPLEWIEGTNRIADEFFRYADPLIGSIPEYAILR
jgi:6-phosphofructokinase 1